MDLRRDQYFALSDAQAKAFSILFPQFQAGMNEADSAHQRERPERCMEELVAKGLLTTDARIGRTQILQRVVAPERALMDEYLQNEIPIRASHIRCFLASWAAAAIGLRLKNIEHVVRAVEQQKHRASTAHQPRQTLHELYTVFERLRPWFYTARQACLFDSLALVEFLARYGLSATWVFGVRTAPFAAHSWVQDDDLVLNDSAENVRKYTPILVV